MNLSYSEGGDSALEMEPLTTQDKKETGRRIRKV